MTLGFAALGSAVAALIVAGAVFLLTRKRLPLPLIPALRKKSADVSAQEGAALMALARVAVARYPELGAAPAELLTEINAYCDKARSSPDRTSRIILEKLLAAGSLRQARSYWQVHQFLDYRDHVRKTRRP
jgi:hypothetical protein